MKANDLVAEVERTDPNVRFLIEKSDPEQQFLELLVNDPPRLEKAVGRKSTELLFEIKITE